MLSWFKSSRPSSSDQRLTRKFGAESTASDVLNGVNLKGKTALVTGGEAGIGAATVRALALQNAHVVLTTHKVWLARELRAKIVAEKKDALIEIMNCDMRSIQSVITTAYQFLERGWPLHMLILNEGVCGPREDRTVDGIEATFGVNHLSNFCLTNLLLPRMQKHAPGRIVILTSKYHEDIPFSPNVTPEKLTVEILNPKDRVASKGSVTSLKLYALSKLCNLWHAFALQRKLQDDNIAVFVVYPGLVRSSLGESTLGRALVSVSGMMSKTKTPDQAAATVVYCATANQLRAMGGKYWVDCWMAEPSELANKTEFQDKLWKLSHEMTNEITGLLGQKIVEFRASGKRKCSV